MEVHILYKPGRYQITVGGRAPITYKVCTPSLIYRCVINHPTEENVNFVIMSYPIPKLNKPTQAQTTELIHYSSNKNVEACKTPAKYQKPFTDSQ